MALLCQSLDILDPPPHIYCSDRSRISRGAPTPEGGASAYYFAKFLPKIHENERSWTQRRGESLATPTGPPLPIRSNRSNGIAVADVDVYLVSSVGDATQIIQFCNLMVVSAQVTFFVI